MAEFCTCGSLKFKGNCSNKKCPEHSASGFEPASYKQLEHIMELWVELGEDPSDCDLKDMSKKDASRLIEELEDELELN